MNFLGELYESSILLQLYYVYLPLSFLCILVYRIQGMVEGSENTYPGIALSFGQMALNKFLSETEFPEMKRKGEGRGGQGRGKGGDRREERRMEGGRKEGENFNPCPSYVTQFFEC